MNKLLTAIAVLTMPAIVSAQSPVDAYNLSQSDMRGSARFMSMGGAFTALGGDISTINQNPAGLGVYRRSEISLTLDLSPQKITSTSATDKISRSQTNFNCDNFGYVGTVELDGAVRSLSWGVSFNRAASFERSYKAYNGIASSSLTNYIADYTNGIKSSDMLFGKDYNPYINTDIDWLSILAYNSYLINPVSDTSYKGLWGEGTSGDSYAEIRESGYIDEYSVDFGGNVEDVVYWGLGIGFTDLKFDQRSYYSENMQNADIYGEQGITKGDAYYDLYDSKRITGSGWNLKLGVIVKPVNELRIGLAFHTPTWYSLSTDEYAETYYEHSTISGEEYTENAYYNFRLNSPWKMMVGVAGVIGSKGLVSFDYERQSFADMSTKYQDGWDSYTTDDFVKDKIKSYYKATNIFRLGAEYRVTPKFSVRAGYNYSTTNVKDEAQQGALEVLTSGMNPSFVTNKSTNAISCGLGYRYQAFYVDAAYVYRNRKSTFHAYSDLPGYVVAPKAELSEINHSVILTLGFKL